MHLFTGGIFLRDVELHIIHFFWDDFTPYLGTHPVVVEGKSLKHPWPSSMEVRRITPGEVWDYTILPGRWCVGRLDDNYKPCPDGRLVGEFPLCSSCRTALGKPSPREIFEPDEGCAGELCDMPHVVYLAFYGERMKVGMTPEERLIRRGIEQGADAIGPLLHLESRREARIEEKRIAAEFRIPQALSTREVLQGLSRGFSRRVIEQKYRRVVRAVGGEGELKFLEGYPMTKLPSTPTLFKGKRIKGRILGIKGRYMIVYMGGHKAVNLRRLLGRVVRVEQLSLHFNFAEPSEGFPGRG